MEFPGNPEESLICPAPGSAACALLRQAADVLAESRNNALRFARTQIDLGQNLIELAIQEYEIREVENANRSIIHASQACDIASRILARLPVAAADQRGEELENRIGEVRARIAEAIATTGLRPGLADSGPD